MNITLSHFLYIGLGGFFGSISRFFLSTLIQEKFKLAHIPWGTLTVNLLGSFLIGLVFSISLKRSDAKDFIQLCLMTGFLGAFTTFSTYSLESITRLQAGFYKAAFFNFFLNNSLCFIACFLGLSILSSKK